MLSTAESKPKPIRATLPAKNPAATATAHSTRFQPMVRYSSEIPRRTCSDRVSASVDTARCYRFCAPLEYSTLQAFAIVRVALMKFTLALLQIAPEGYDLEKSREKGILYCQAPPDSKDIATCCRQRWVQWQSGGLRRVVQSLLTLIRPCFGRTNSVIYLRSVPGRERERALFDKR